jgi:hypothetical protein
MYKSHFSASNQSAFSPVGRFYEGAECFKGRIFESFIHISF